ARRLIGPIRDVCVGLGALAGPHGDSSGDLQRGAMLLHDQLDFGRLSRLRLRVALVPTLVLGKLTLGSVERVRAAELRLRLDGHRAAPEQESCQCGDSAFEASHDLLLADVLAQFDGARLPLVYAWAPGILLRAEGALPPGEARAHGCLDGW